MSEIKEEEIELEKYYPSSKIADKLRRLADALESQKSFRIQVDGVKIRVPAHVSVDIEYEKKGEQEELEFELKWKSE